MTHDPLVWTFENEDERSFVRQIIESPDDITPRLVYADWLEEYDTRPEHDGRRPEYLRLQFGVAAGSKSAAHAEREESLRSSIERTWLALMHNGDAWAKLRKLQESIPKWDECSRGYKPFLELESIGGLIKLHFSGSLMLLGDEDEPEEDVGAVFRLVSDPVIAPCLHSIKLDGHEDRGRANGTLEIELNHLAESEVGYPRLIDFETERGGGIILTGHIYDEDGVTARFLKKCPQLRRLAIPSAPDDTFFRFVSHPLQELTVYAGYDHQKFVKNLASSTCFGALRILKYQDFCNTYMDDWQQLTTPFEDYMAFFRSRVCSQLEEIHLEVALSEPEVEQLLDVRSDGVTIRPFEEGAGQW